jgi:hypothetical protein
MKKKNFMKKKNLMKKISRKVLFMIMIIMKIMSRMKKVKKYVLMKIKLSIHIIPGVNSIEDNLTIILLMMK